MKDLRDIIQLIEEKSHDFDDSHPHFDGVWDSFNKISNMSVPDASTAPSIDVVRERRRRQVSANVKRKTRDAKMKKTDEASFSMLHDDD